ncbi:Gfo/Idh/MocA family protein [Devosia nitrariae]|uniref:3-chlorobenzoate-3,4-dioxygenase dehydrogenase n=1 Tax=Devosia nitrariae TaxID=2071872 RepID=A0ABQ5W8R1_9HYPH|nr:Gfo/Idh/MocA family oxidoreductase [Devosia nitrariae]GLQ56156.1 3-chlorobenzoate-3,4-dioxygenase dehydrogenase [Devosia nitrariae]
MRRYRAGAIGDTGHVDNAGRYLGFDASHGLHLPYKDLEQFEMTAVADHDPSARAHGMDITGALRSYSDYREMLATERLDIVSVCSRQASRHEEMVLAAVATGCHVFVDKPFTVDLASADRIVHACDAAGVKLAVAHQSRYLEPFLTAHQMLLAGEIGSLVTMRGRVKEDHRGGGEDVICCGVHILDLMRMFAGDPQWVSAYVSVEGRAVTKADAYVPVDCNGLVAGDRTDAAFGFEGGVIGHLTSVRNQHDWGERWGLTLEGTRGAVSLRMFNDLSSPSKLSISRKRSVPEEAGPFEILEVPLEPEVPGAVPANTGYPPLRGNRQAVFDLMKAAEERREPKSSARDGRWTLEMALGIYQSHLSQRRVALPLADRSHPLE